MSLSETEQLIEQLEKNYPKGFDLSLGRITNLLQKLGNPHQALPPIFHVAGTNGKGSTCAFCRAILEAHGLKVHMHSSPHLVNWHERFRLASAQGSHFVEDKLLAATLQKIVHINQNAPITIFELLMATTFVLFKEYPADAIILEVGLGGQFDASNIIPSPEVSIITNIAFDHENFLGHDIKQIAFEKAGIIKTGRPVVVSHQIYEAVIPILTTQAQKMQSSLTLFGQDYISFSENGAMVFQDRTGLMDLPLPALFGLHQIFNAATAIAALKQSCFSLCEKAIAQGLQQVSWPGRMQILPQGNLQKYLPTNTEIWIDGGHNADAAHQVSQSLQILEKKYRKKTILIFGMLKSKNASAYLDMLKDTVNEVITLTIPNDPLAFSGQELLSIAKNNGYTAQEAKNLSDALQIITTQNKDQTSIRVLMAGSLHFVGAVLRENGTHPE